MGNAEFKGLTHVSPISTQELLAICRQAMAADDLIKGTEGDADYTPPFSPNLGGSSPFEPWHAIDRTQFSLLFDNGKVPYQFLDQLFDAYTVTMRDLGGEEGLRRPEAFTKPLSRPDPNKTSATAASASSPFSPTALGSNTANTLSGSSFNDNSSIGSNANKTRGDLNEVNIRGVELSDPLARVDFSWLLLHLFAVLPHSAPMALVGDVERGLQNIAISRNFKGSMAANWVEGGHGARPPSGGGGGAYGGGGASSAYGIGGGSIGLATAALIPVDTRLSIIYDVLLRRVQRNARIKAAARRREEKKANSNTTTNNNKSRTNSNSGPANTPTKLAMIRNSRNNSNASPCASPSSPTTAEDVIPTDLSIADIKDAFFATAKLAVMRYRGVRHDSGRTQYLDRRCAGCQTIPTNLTYDCHDCHEASVDRHFTACADMLREAQAMSPRSGGGGRGGYYSTSGSVIGVGGNLTARTDATTSYGAGGAESEGNMTRRTVASASSYSPENALLSATAMTAPVHVMGIPITTLLCNRCVGQYEGYGSGVHQCKHLRTHTARRSNWAPNPLEVTHLGTECSACGASPITGARYRCLDCLDRVDLCEACHRDAEEPLCHSIRHRMWKITVPLTVDEEVNSFIEEIIAPLYDSLRLPKPPHAVTRRVNPNHQDTDYSEHHNVDYSVTHFTDALLTVDQRREVAQERSDAVLLEALKGAALRIANEWPAHISELLDEDRTLQFLEAQERGEHALAEYKRDLLRLAAEKKVADRERALQEEAAEREAVAAALGVAASTPPFATIVAPRDAAEDTFTPSPRRGVGALSRSSSAAAGSHRNVHFNKQNGANSPTNNNPLGTVGTAGTGGDGDDGSSNTNTAQRRVPSVAGATSPVRRPLSAALQAQAMARGDVVDTRNKAPEDVAAARLAHHFIVNNSDDHTYITKDVFIRWGNNSEVIAALFRGFEVRHAKTCTEMEGVEYTEYSSSMGTSTGAAAVMSEKL